MAAGKAVQLQNTVVPDIPHSSPMPMETPPNLQVYDLGLVASVLDRIRLVETVDRPVAPPGPVRAHLRDCLKTFPDDIIEHE
jgi:hypothetical protein